MNIQKATSSTIHSSEISVIIQGPTFYDPGNENCQFTKCVASIKHYLPEAEIILSTWRGQEFDSGIIDKVVYNDDPGTIKSCIGKPWNYNRMVVTTLKGLAVATRPYALKLRADLTLTGLEMIKMGKHPSSECSSRYKIFKQPVTISNIFVRNPASHAPLLFHASDIVQFGLTQDLLDLWNRDFIREDQIKAKKTLWSALYFLGYTGLRMVPEQALTIGWLNTHGYNIFLPFPGFLSRKYCELSEMVLSTNFHLVNWNEAGILYPKRFLSEKRTFNSIYSAAELSQIALRSDGFRKYRYLKIILQAILLQPFRKYFWIDFFASILLWISPNAFERMRCIWRRLGPRNNTQPNH